MGAFWPGHGNPSQQVAPLGEPCVGGFPFVPCGVAWSHDPHHRPDGRALRVGVGRGVVVHEFASPMIEAIVAASIPSWSILMAEVWRMSRNVVLASVVPTSPRVSARAAHRSVHAHGAPLEVEPRPLQAAYLALPHAAVQHGPRRNGQARQHGALKEAGQTRAASGRTRRPSSSCARCGAAAAPAAAHRHPPGRRGGFAAARRRGRDEAVAGYLVGHRRG